MSDQELESTNLEDDPLSHWRQGDFAYDVGGFLFAGTAEGDDHFDAEETSENIVGLVAISQTCDIVRPTGGRNFIAVCPLTNIPNAELTAIRKGRRPYYVDIENAGETEVVDLRRIMSVHKDVVQTWSRRDGFSDDAGRIRFAAALERKFGQFAFQDKFDSAIKEFRERVWKRHDRFHSEPGKVYRSLVQIRFRATPNWEAESRKITVLAIMRDESDCEVDRSTMNRELDSILGKVSWPIGYEWDEPKYILATAKDLTAEDILSSQRGDFDFLCF